MVNVDRAIKNSVELWRTITIEDASLREIAELEIASSDCGKNPLHGVIFSPSIPIRLRLRSKSCDSKPA